MCIFRRVHRIYQICGHEYDSEEMIDCHSPACKFSAYHQQGPHDCRRTCLQYRQFPQSYGT
ncbi:hypothetical protein CPB86DRAFT_665709, partial [Serendipita vermifera]